MSVRKREWTTGQGAAREAWVVDYADGHGKRRLKTFPRKKEADKFAATTHVEIGQGVHVPDRESVTVREAGALWLAGADAAELERATVDGYRQELTLHIVPFIGNTKLSKLTTPAVREFTDRLRLEGRSPSMVRRVIKTLGSILGDAQDRGLVIRNVVRERQRGRRGQERKAEKRQRGKLRVGTDIPTPEEIRLILEHAKGRWRPLLMTASLTGLRASELRGLRWSDLELDGRTVHVRQRADRYNVLGPPKSAAGERSIPLPSTLVAVLREWRETCPKSDADLVFPTGAGNVDWLSNLINRGLKPAQVAAGLTVPILNAQGQPKRDPEGKPMVKAKYTGMHALRHFYASWCINCRADGGLELPPKVAQERLGHASIAMTFDVYGHLFPRGDDLSELDAAERALLDG